MFGGGSTKTTEKTQLPGYINEASQRAVELGQRAGQQAYTPYIGERVVGLTDNERSGIHRARTFGQQASGYLDQAAGAIGALRTGNIDQYVNPYIKGALDPAARDISEWSQRRRDQIGGQASSAGAWSPSRVTLQEGMVEREHNRALKDLYGQGRMEAFERGASRAAQEASQFMQAAGVSAGLDAGAIESLMRTGATDRQVQQAMADFDYGQFVEGRDWDVRNMNAILQALQGAQGSYDVTRISKTEEQGSAFGQIVGLAATVAGAYMTGGGSLLAGGLMSGAGGALSSGGSGVWNSGTGSYTMPSGWSNADLFGGP